MIGHGNDATYKNDFQIFKIARNGSQEWRAFTRKIMQSSKSEKNLGDIFAQ